MGKHAFGFLSQMTFYLLGFLNADLTAVTFIVQKTSDSFSEMNLKKENTNWVFHLCRKWVMQFLAFHQLRSDLNRKWKGDDNVAVMT